MHCRTFQIAYFTTTHWGVEFAHKSVFQLKMSHKDNNNNGSAVVSAITRDHTDKIILRPFEYIMRVPGKDFRSQLIDAFNMWLKVDTDKLDKIKIIIAQLHNASLLVDDIEDDSQLRRGAPVAHNIFGIASTINAANYVYFLALQMTHELGVPEAIRVFMEELIHLHRGQGMDIYWRDNVQCPTEEDYIEMVQNKTGGLFRLSVRLMQVFSDFKADLKPLVNLLGHFFQILDDYQNLLSEKYHENKSYCEDLTEGKFSFPIIHSIRVRPDDSCLLNILKKKTTDVELKKYAVQIMRETASFEYTERILVSLYDQLLAEIDSSKFEGFGPNEKLKAILRWLVKDCSFLDRHHDNPQ